MRREGKQQLFMATQCVNHKLITGSEAEKTTSAMVNNLHAKTQNKQAMSFVTSASRNSSQNELVRKFISLLSFSSRKVGSESLGVLIS